MAEANYGAEGYPRSTIGSAVWSAFGEAYGRLAGTNHRAKPCYAVSIETAPAQPAAQPVTGERSDEQLMLAYRDGDVAAFDVLFGRYKDMLYRYLVRQSGNAALAEEMFQEVWAGLIRQREAYSVQAKFRTYLFHIAHNKLIDYYRSRSRVDAVSYDEDAHDMADDSDAQNRPEHQADVAQRTAHLLALLEKLPAAQREVFLMHEEAGMSLAEIAETMQVSRDTIKSRLRYALARLRRGMERYA